jgi:hypothetical protein
MRWQARPNQWGRLEFNAAFSLKDDSDGQADVCPIGAVKAMDISYLAQIFRKGSQNGSLVKLWGLYKRNSPTGHWQTGIAPVQPARSPWSKRGSEARRCSTAEHACLNLQ